MLSVANFTFIYVDTGTMEAVCVPRYLCILFRYENQFKLHLAVHKEGKFVCSQCGKQLVTKRYLIQHEKTGHGAQEISCQVVE